MSDKSYHPKIIFPDSFDERSRFEMPLRGCLSHVLVELENGSRYSVDFIDPVRLAQEMNDNVRLNIPCYAEPGLIVLPEVTLERIKEAVRYLHRHGFFEHLKPDNKLASSK
jgi:hypothetical protein